MTAHRAALPATTEFSGVSRVELRAASAPHGMRQVSGPVGPAHPASPARPALSPPSLGTASRPPAQPSATCVLGSRPESVKTGRDFTRSTLLDWDLPALADLAELVVSELVTNALRHGIPSARALGDHCVRLRLLAQAPFVMCMVTDPGSDIPVLRESEPLAESGRGLNVVESCCVRWGWHLLDEGGKVVWALLRPPL
jgi:anti-sigma regulatory factor (Ser/Thr protein kinase)